MEKNILYETELYTYMKRIYGNAYKLNLKELRKLEEFLIEWHENRGLDAYEEIKEELFKLLDENLVENKYSEYERLILLWKDRISLACFVVALYLIKNKNDVINSIKRYVQEYSCNESSCEELTLSLKYDNINVNSVYISRIMIPHVISQKIKEYLKNEEKVFYEAALLLEDEEISIVGPYFSIISESLKQGAVSSGGTSYENLVFEYLLKIGLDESINRMEKFSHEDDIGSLENDVKFYYKDICFGISDKKTLRERYKQYVNLIERDHETDIFMCITLGTDLSCEKAKTIRSFGVYVFVAPEVYNAKSYLQEIDGVYSIYDLNLQLLDEMIERYTH